MELAWFVGVDWGSQTHQACVIDVAGKLLGERAFEHGGQGLSEMADWVVSFAAGEADQVGVAIETPRGPVVESPMERGLAVHAINPKQLDRFRDRLSPAGAKDDRRDARVLASALRTDPHCLRRLEPTDPAIVELREWSRISEELTRERTRQANRMREQLWRYYPQLLAATSDDIAAPWALDLWRRLPTPAAAQRVREATLAKLLQQHRIRRVDAAVLRERLRAPAVRVAPTPLALRLPPSAPTQLPSPSSTEPFPLPPWTSDSPLIRVQENRGRNTRSLGQPRHNYRRKPYV